VELLARLPPRVIGMEACSGAHLLARVLVQFGHTPMLMAPKLVAPYRMQGANGKNDANNTAAICEAVSWPNMRFVPVKSVDAQITLSIHRVRSGFVAERTAAINRLRGLIAEFGVILPTCSVTSGRSMSASINTTPISSRLP